MLLPELSKGSEANPGFSNFLGCATAEPLPGVPVSEQGGSAGAGGWNQSWEATIPLGPTSAELWIPGADAVCSHRPPVPKMPETAALPTRFQPTVGMGKARLRGFAAPPAFPEPPSSSQSGTAFL